MQPCRPTHALKRPLFSPSVGYLRLVICMGKYQGLLRYSGLRYPSDVVAQAATLASMFLPKQILTRCLPPHRLKKIAKPFTHPPQIRFIVLEPSQPGRES